VSVEHVGRPFRQLVHGSVDQSDVELERPGDHVVERWRVSLDPHHSNALLDLLVRCAGQAARINGHLVAAEREMPRQLVDVPGEPADDDGRVLP
jgi:hypothetical protein